MKTILDVISNFFFAGVAILLAGVIATYLFIMHWGNGVVLFFKDIGAEQYISPLVLYDPLWSDVLVYSVAILTSVALIAILRKVSDMVRNSFWTVITCLLMIVVIVVPAYYSYSNGALV